MLSFWSLPVPARRAREAEIAVIRPAQPRSAHQAVAGATERRLPGAMEVPIEQVVADPAQPRRDWGHNDGGQRLEELAASIREFGILQPLIVREAGTLNDGRQRYVIIAGARRRTASERAGLATVPVLLRDEPSTQVRVLQLIENLQRQELSPLDEARAYQELSDLENLSPPELAARLHISAQHVRDRLRVLADQVLADAVERRQISATTARDIMQLPDEELMAFRARVLRGERLQTNDIAVARARLAAAGIVNPRRKLPAGKKQTSFVPASVSTPLHGVTAGDAAAQPPDAGPHSEQTSFVYPGDNHPTTTPEPAEPLAAVIPTNGSEPAQVPGLHVPLTGNDEIDAGPGEAARTGATNGQAASEPDRGARLLEWIAQRSRYDGVVIGDDAARKRVAEALTELVAWATGLQERMDAELGEAS